MDLRWSALAVLMAGCNCGQGPIAEVEYPPEADASVQAGASDAGKLALDAGAVKHDAGAVADAGNAHDAGVVADAGRVVDAGEVEEDAGSKTDAGKKCRDDEDKDNDDGECHHGRNE